MLPGSLITDLEIADDACKTRKLFPYTITEIG